MEPEYLLGLCLISFLALGLGTQLARQGQIQYVFILALGTLSLFAMVFFHQLMAERTSEFRAHRDGRVDHIH